VSSRCCWPRAASLRLWCSRPLQAPKAIQAETASLLVGAVAVSMLLSPLLLVAIDRLLLPRFANCDATTLEEISEPQSAPSSSRALAVTGRSWPHAQRPGPPRHGAGP
jgi:hypothetical protein